MKYIIEAIINKLGMGKNAMVTGYNSILNNLQDLFGGYATVVELEDESNETSKVFRVTSIDASQFLIRYHLEMRGTSNIVVKDIEIED